MPPTKAKARAVTRNRAWKPTPCPLPYEKGRGDVSCTEGHRTCANCRAAERARQAEALGL